MEMNLQLHHVVSDITGVTGMKIIRRSSSRAAALLRFAAVTIGRSDTALGAFYRRLAARAGKAKVRSFAA